MTRTVMALAVTGAVLGACAAPTSPAPELGAVVKTVQDRAPEVLEPTSAERAEEVSAAVAALVEGDQVPTPAQYAVHEVSLGGHGTARALVPVGAPTTGEGLFVARDPQETVPLAIEIPHPRSDRFTDEMGTTVFERTRARVLLMAGSLRDAGDDADPAHAGDAVLAAADRAVVGPGWVVVQLHGFSAARHPDYPSVVIASGVADPGPVLRDVADEVAAAGFTVLVAEGNHGERLAARTNVQGRHAAEVGAEFVHVETADHVRHDPAQRERLVAAVTKALTAPG